MRSIVGSAILLLVCCSGFAQPDSVFAVVADDSVTIWNTGVNEQCGARFMIEVNLLRDSAVVVERDTFGAIATCDCLFNLSVSLTGVPAGQYVAVVYREYLRKHGYPQDLRRYVGVAKFFIGTPRSELKVSQYQSPCIISHAAELPNPMPMYRVLYPNYPNPFNASTEMRYDVSPACHVTIAVYDLLGREVVTLVDEHKAPGSYKTRWDGRGINGQHVASGVYMCQMNAGSFYQTHTLLVLQ